MSFGRTAFYNISRGKGPEAMEVVHTLEVSLKSTENITQDLCDQSKRAAQLICVARKCTGPFWGWVLSYFWQGGGGMKRDFPFLQHRVTKHWAVKRISYSEIALLNTSSC